MRTLALIVATLVTSFARADSGTIGVYQDLPGSLCFDAFVQKSIDGQLGWFGYLAVTEGWSEAYVGPTYSPSPNFQVGLGYGIEQADDPGRFGGYVWAGHGKADILYLFEDGGSGWWQKLTLGYQVDKRWKVALVDRRGAGIGGQVGYQLDKATRLRLSLFGDMATVATQFDF